MIHKPSNSSHRPLSPSPRAVFSTILVIGALISFYVDLERKTFWIVAGFIAVLGLLSWCINRAEKKYRATAGRQGAALHWLGRVLCILGSVVEGVFIGVLAGMVLGSFFGWPGFWVGMVGSVVICVAGELLESAQESNRPSDDSSPGF